MPLSDPTHMNADGIDFCGLHRAGCPIQALYRDQLLEYHTGDQQVAVRFPAPNISQQSMQLSHLEFCQCCENTVEILSVPVHFSLFLFAILQPLCNVLAFRFKNIDDRPMDSKNKRKELCLYYAEKLHEIEFSTQFSNSVNP